MKRMNVMEIQGTPIQIKEYAGQRVVTFKDVDTVHHRASGSARKRFNDNRKHFIEAVDFYRLTQPSEIRTLGFSRPQGGVPSEVILITETGYLMLVKSFTDDLAWKVQRELVDSYFRARAEPEEQTMQEIIDNNIPTVVVATDKLIKCAEIMAGCLEGNRSYVLNILRNVVPNIDEGETKNTECIEVTKVEKPKRKCAEYLPQAVEIDTTKMLLEMNMQGMSLPTLAEKASVSVTAIMSWIKGNHKPLEISRSNICTALGKDDDFLTPKRKRNVKE